MEVLDIKEQEDGSAILTLDISEFELKYFAEIGILKVLKDGMEYEESLRLDKMRK